MGFETPEEGYLAKILITAGTKDVPIGKLVCIIVENESEVAAFNDYKDTGAPAAAKAAPAAAAPQAPVATPSPVPPPVFSPPTPAAAQPMTAVEQKYGGRVYASPMAKKLAESQRLRLEGKGSGLFGSLTSKDLSQLQSSAAAPAAQATAGPTKVPAGSAYIDIPVTNIRGVIAKRLLESKTTIPHYYLTVDCNVDKVFFF